MLLVVRVRTSHQTSDCGTQAFSVWNNTVVRHYDSLALFHVNKQRRCREWFGVVTMLHNLCAKKGFRFLPVIQGGSGLWTYLLRDTDATSCFFSPLALNLHFLSCLITFSHIISLQLATLSKQHNAWKTISYRKVAWMNNIHYFIFLCYIASHTHFHAVA